MAGPFVNPEDTRVQLSNGNSLIFFHTGNLSEVQEQLNTLESNYGAISWGTNDPDPGGDVYYIEIDQTSGQQVAGSHAQLVNTADQYHAQYNAKTLAFDDGSFVVVWSQSQNGGSFATCYQRFDAEGNTLGQNVIMQTMDDPIDTHQLTRDDSGSNGFNISIGRTGEAFHVVSQDFGSSSSDISDGWEDYPATDDGLNGEDEKYIDGLNFIFGVGLRDGSDISVRIEDGSVDLYRIGYNPDRIIHVDRGLLGESYTYLSNVEIWTFGNKGILGVTHKDKFYWRTIELEDTNEIQANETGVTYGEINAIPYSASEDGFSLENVRLNVFKLNDSETGYSGAKFILENMSTGAVSEEVDIFSVLSVHAPDFFEPSSAETVELGSSSDTFFGSAEKDYVETGGGDDAIRTLAGDDFVVVQGQGDVTVSTGSGDDQIEVANDFSGTLFVQSEKDADGLFVEGGGAEVIHIDQETGIWDVDEEGTLTIELLDGSEITVENYLTNALGMGVLTGPTISTNGYEPFDLGFGDLGIVTRRGSDHTNDYLFAVTRDTDLEDDEVPEVDDGVVYVMNGWDGDDTLFGGAGTQLLIGSQGDDEIFISSDQQSTLVIADRLIESTNTGSASGLPSVETENLNYADKVYIDWVYDADSIAEISGTNGQGVVVWNDDLGARVEIYDAEELIFRSATDPTQWDAGISIGETAVVGIGTDPDDPLSWMNGHHGKSFSYAGNNIRFVLTDKPAEDGGPAATLNGDASSDWLQVYATVTKQEAYKVTTGSGRRKKTVTKYRDVEEEALIWEGDRSAVGKFDFEDTDIQVINVQEQDAFGDPILYTAGTENTDLIFGNQYANIIDGGGGDDIIFGGGGDDVLIGGEGDDVITGGEGDDIIRGDSIESDDAAYEAISAMAETLAELAAEEDPNTDIGQVVNDTLNDFSVGTGNDGNDTILGGDGVDDIDSGDGENFVTSGRLELVNEGETDLETLNEHIKSHKDIFEDDDWI